MILPSDFNPSQRAAAAGDYFRQGYNCAQSVVLSFADILEANGLAARNLLATISAGFGGGMGRMREVCGAFSGCTMMAGFISPADDPSKMESRKANYALVQEFAAAFRESNGGSIICRELLGLQAKVQESPAPSGRTPEYYRKRPCRAIVEQAALNVAKKLEELYGETKA